jgi:hypothetical protein
MRGTRATSDGLPSNQSSVAKRVARLADRAASLSLNAGLLTRLHAINSKVRLLAAVHPRAANTEGAPLLPPTTRRLANSLQDGFFANLIRLAAARSIAIADAISRVSNVALAHLLSASSHQLRVARPNDIRRFNGVIDARQALSEESPKRFDSTYLSQLVSSSIRSMRGILWSSIASSNRIGFRPSRFPGRGLDRLSTGRNADGYESYVSNIDNHTPRRSETGRFGAYRITPSRLSSKLPVESGWRLKLRPRHLLEGRTAPVEALDRLASLLSAQEKRMAEGKSTRYSALESIRRAIALRQHDFQRYSIKETSAGIYSALSVDTAPPGVNSSPRLSNRKTPSAAREIIVNYSPTLVVQGGSNVQDIEARLLEAIGHSGYELAKILDREYARRARVELL